ncbi:hypothetical protein SDJN03_12819, partial [Cucurbita argyrosperma subsp. sororia]
MKLTNTPLMEGGEVRRLHVVYFLSRMGHVEQPHLIRVHHLPRRGGVYLRDNSRLCSSSSHTKDLDAYEDSERSTVTDDGDSMKVEERAKNLEAAKQGIVERTMQKEGEPMSTVSSASSSSKQHAFTKSKSYSSGASTMLRQWITCGAIDTNDSVLIKNPSPKDSSLEKPKNGAVFCRDDEMGGSARVAVTHKPMAGPNCSLCGKSFKPEKMHSHMKSCKGLKSLTKTATTSTKSKSTTAKSSDKELVSTYLLTN